MATEDKLTDFMSDADGAARSEAIDDDAGAATTSDSAAEYQPQYRVLTEDRIPVSKRLGPLWQSRKDAGASRVKESGHLDRWNDAIDYYRNDQSGSRRHNGSEDISRVRSNVTLTTKGRESENIVFANVSALVPATYTKNPKITLTTENAELQPFCRAGEKLVNALIAKEAAPGVNLKPHMRRAIIMANLTNLAYVDVGYTKRAESSEDTLKEINNLANELKNAKSRKVIQEIEGKLSALEDKVDLLRPSGPWVKFRRPHDVIVDPNATSFHDAAWVMVSELVPTTFLKAMYGKKNEKGEYESIFEPGYVLKIGQNAENSLDDLASFRLFNTDTSPKDYGYSNDEAFDKAQYTRVWYVWDKTTRRMYLFNDDAWKWPIWVWDDPTNLDTFFSLTPLEFYTDPSEYYARGEVTYYLDQQDALNEINNEIAKARSFAIGKLIYNKNLVKDERTIDAFLAGTGGKRILGVDVPPDADVNKLFTPFMPQSTALLQTIMFNKDNVIQAIDRVSSVTNVMRGVEYKTNTTNKAIESYESNTQTRLDEKIDAIEDFLGKIGWKMLQLCVQNMEVEQVASIIGKEAAQGWANKPDIQTLQTHVYITCIGGSTLKPTSANKKAQAAQLGQILGQFARSTPAAVLVALKVMEKAYDEVIIAAEDWQMIIQGIQGAMQAQAQQGQAQQPAQQGPAGQSAGGQAQGAQARGVPIEEALAKLEEIVDGLDPRLKQELGKMLASNIPIRQAVGAVVAQSGGQ